MSKITRTEHNLSEEQYQCGHCGIKTLMFTICTGSHMVTEDDPGYSSLWFLAEYKFLLCPSCHEINAIQIRSDSEHSYDINEHETVYEQTTEYLYPRVRVGNLYSLPDAVEKSYAIAFKLRKIEPTASVVFARKSLEAICNDQKTSGKNLKEKIDELAKRGSIPKLLGDAAHSIRLIGNEGAHEFDANITFEDADILINLCDAIVSYVYEAPQLIYKIQSKLRKSEA